MQNTETSVPERIRKEIAEYPVVLYMKGNASVPQCGFSANIVHLLRLLGIPFHDVNVLEDNALRSGIKEFSNWPTIPQLYVKGEFIGGADIVREMWEAGELRDFFAKRGIDARQAAQNIA